MSTRTLVCFAIGMMIGGIIGIPVGDWIFNTYLARSGYQHHATGDIGRSLGELDAASSKPIELVK